MVSVIGFETLAPHFLITRTPKTEAVLTHYQI
jgi:hypothetical protein